jgi:hypothetical protein
MKTYYSIAVQFDQGDTFSLQFGDYDKAVVQQELWDTYSGCHKTRLIRSGDTTEEINAAVAKLNA